MVKSLSNIKYLVWPDQNFTKYIYWILRVVLGLIFVYAGIAKSIDIKLFVVAVENYRLLPDCLVPFFALVLPIVEILAGLLLIVGFKALPAVTLINLMLIVFIIALSISLARGLNVDCGCFGVDLSDNKHSLFTAIWRDIGMLVMGLWITGYLWKKRSH